MSASHISASSMALKLGLPYATSFKDLPDMIAVKDAKFSDVDAVFCCLPHGTTQDFRLRDISEYEEWYGQPHKATDLQKEAVYGLAEILRSEIQSAHAWLQILAKLIEVKNIIIDSKSGVSGAGCGAKEANLYTEIAEGIYSYGVTRHRHAPEIEQGLSDAAHSKVTISFTPHLMPMSRGMQSTIYVEMAPGVSSEDLNQHLRSFYESRVKIKLQESWNETIGNCEGLAKMSASYYMSPASTHIQSSFTVALNLGHLVYPPLIHDLRMKNLLSC